MAFFLSYILLTIYRCDPSHVSFYSKRTLEFIAKEFNWKIEFFDQDLALFSS